MALLSLVFKSHVGRMVVGLGFGITLLLAVLVNQQGHTVIEPTQQQAYLDKGNIRLFMESQFEGEIIHVCITSCGADPTRLAETKVLIKSCVMFTFHKVHMHVFVTPDVQPILERFVEAWPHTFRHRVHISFYAPYFPSDNWRAVHRQCGPQRLFLMYKLPKTVTKVLYLDSDSIVLTPLEDIWAEFEQFRAETRMAMALNTEMFNGWYSYHPEIPLHPKYKPHGFNSGVLLMDIEKIRADPLWMLHIHQIYTQQGINNTLGDQDILNQYLSMFPDQVHKLPCSMNFRTDFCVIVNSSLDHTCPGLEDTGALVLHGNRYIFHHGQSAFRYMFKIFEKYNFESDLEADFLPSIHRMRFETTGTCIYIHPMFYRRIEEYIRLMKGDHTILRKFTQEIYDVLPYHAIQESQERDRTRVMYRASVKNTKTPVQGQSNNTGTAQGQGNNTVTAQGQGNNTVTAQGQVNNTVTAQGQVNNTVTAQGQVNNTVTAQGRVYNSVTTQGQIKNIRTAQGQDNSTGTAQRQGNSTRTAQGQVNNTIFLQEQGPLPRKHSTVSHNNGQARQDNGQVSQDLRQINHGPEKQHSGQRKARHKSI